MYYKIGKRYIRLGESKLQFKHQDTRTIKIMRKNVKKINANRPKCKANLHQKQRNKAHDTFLNEGNFEMVFRRIFSTTFGNDAQQGQTFFEIHSHKKSRNMYSLHF